MPVHDRRTDAVSAAYLAFFGDKLLVWALTLTVALLPFTLPVFLRVDADSALAGMSFYPVDLGLALLVTLGLPRLARALRQGRHLLPLRLLAVWTALTVLATAVHPSAAGVELCLRLLGVMVIVALFLVRGMPRPVTVVVALVGLEESVLAVGQVLAGHGLGFTALGIGESRKVHLIPFSGLPSARGTLFHPYILAGLSMVFALLLASRALRREHPSVRFLFLVAVVIVPVGLTYSRMSVLAVAGIAVALLLGRPRRSHLRTLAALGLGLGVPALLTVHGWVGRTQQSVAAASTGNVEGLSSGRVTFVRQAAGLIRSHPLTGIGPAQYTAVLGRLEPRRYSVYPVHNVPLLVAAESGVFAGMVVVALLILLALAAYRSGGAGVAVYLSLLPFLLLDHFAYSGVQGLVLFGLWVGAVLSDGRVSATPPAAPAAASRRLAA